MERRVRLHVKIKSISPLFIGDNDNEMLIDNDSNMAYLPATGIAGSFRAYLKAIGENDGSLFGFQEKKVSNMSSIYISDSYAPVINIEKRDGLKIDKEMGSNVHRSKIERFYLGKGLEFELKIEIHGNKENIIKYKEMVYKCINALDKGYIRYGSNKSSGLGNFEVVGVEEIKFDFSKINDFKEYLNRDYERMVSVAESVLSIKQNTDFVEFIMEGAFLTPFLIKAPDRFEIDLPDSSNLKSGDDYIIPGSSFKGVLRSRVEKISDYFGHDTIARELFGEDNNKNNRNKLSRIIVKETKITESGETIYNKIKIDRFTGGARGTALMDELPIKGKAVFNVIYRKSGNRRKDNYAIGILALALRDLGTGNLVIGGNTSIGRGRFAADSIILNDGAATINFDFYNDSIDNEETVNEYLKAVKSYREEVQASEK